MITRPGVSKILQSVAQDLIHSVEPALQDETLITKVRMMSALLDATARRCEYGDRWSREEITAIVLAAQQAVADNPDNSALARALEVVDTETDIAAQYEQASELLSCLAEVAFTEDNKTLQNQVETLLQLRMQHETEIIGENFQALGRG